MNKLVLISEMLYKCKVPLAVGSERIFFSADRVKTVASQCKATGVPQNNQAMLKGTDSMNGCAQWLDLSLIHWGQHFQDTFSNVICLEITFRHFNIFLKFVPSSVHDKNSASVQVMALRHRCQTTAGTRANDEPFLWRTIGTRRQWVNHLKLFEHIPTYIYIKVILMFYHQIESKHMITRSCNMIC